MSTPSFPAYTPTYRVYNAQEVLTKYFFYDSRDRASRSANGKYKCTVWVRVIASHSSVLHPLTLVNASLYIAWIPLYCFISFDLFASIAKTV